MWEKYEKALANKEAIKGVKIRNKAHRTLTLTDPKGFSISGLKFEPGEQQLIGLKFHIPKGTKAPKEDQTFDYFMSHVLKVRNPKNG